MKPVITISGSGNITAVMDGKVFTIDKTFVTYDLLVKSIREENWEAFKELVNLPNSIKKLMKSDDYSIVAGQIFFKGEPANQEFVDKAIIGFQNLMKLKVLRTK